MNWKLAPLFILSLTSLAACGGGGSGTVTPPPPAISVAFATAPPASMNTGAQVMFSATVTNDSANAGVTWSCTPANSCGSFSPTSTASGVSTTYTAPASVPSGGRVTVTATSVTDPTKTAPATITINGPTVNFQTAPPASLNTGAQAMLTATVTNDSASAGVTWSCTPANSCGSFSPTSTASGVSTTYTAPASVPSGGKVTVTATSVTDPTKTAPATITINGPTITVTISQAPPLVLQTSATASVTATITGDTANAGVTWTCTPVNSCGSFSSANTASGVATTYKAPSAVPPGAQVTVTATSVTDSTKFANSNPVTITGTASINTLQPGHYAFLVTSPTGNRGTAAWVGSVNLNGTGGVLGGVEDVVSPLRDDQADLILTTSTYTVDSTGHGILTMQTMNGETLVISFVLTSPTHAEVIEADGNPGSGTFDLQQPTSTGFSASQLSGAYAYTLVGIDASGTTHPEQALGGIFTFDSTANSISGTIDTTSVGGALDSATFSAGTISTPPDPNGRGTFDIFPSSPEPSRSFTFYIVSNKVVRFFESGGVSFLGGSMYSQGSATAALSGNFAYQHSGWISTGRAVAAGQFSVPAGSTTISIGISDANAGGAAPTTPAKAVAVSGSFVLSPSLNGTLTLTDAAGNSTFNVYLVDPTINILDPNNATGSGGALLLHTDANINGTGLLLPQQAPNLFVANYALNLTNPIAASTPNELDLVGVLAADGVSSFGTTNLADYDQNNATPTPMLNAPLSGTFAPDASHSGRLTGTLTVGLPAAQPTGYPFIPGTTPPSTLNVSFYQASPSQAFVVQTDSSSSGSSNSSGILMQQQLP